jgi:hypothetical protein
MVIAGPKVILPLKDVFPLVVINVPVNPVKSTGGIIAALAVGPAWIVRVPDPVATFMSPNRSKLLPTFNVELLLPKGLMFMLRLPVWLLKTVINERPCKSNIVPPVLLFTYRLLMAGRAIVEESVVPLVQPHLLQLKSYPL